MIRVGGQALPRDRLQRLQIGVVVPEPMCSMSCDPRRDEHAICTTVGP
jgi:hypothetical protein